MGIISVSLPEEAIKKLDKVVFLGGFKGRSDAVRSSLSLLARDFENTQDINGKINGVLVLVHDERYEHAFSEARHEFEGLIKTLIHNQLGGGKCLELFVLEGESEKVTELIKVCRKSGRAEYLKLITT
jgi:CopG family nickel-responsive transcriptional regulator